MVNEYHFESNDFFAYLKSIRLNHSACVDHVNIIQNMMNTGVVDEELLNGDYIDFVDKWLSEYKPMVKSKDSKRRFRYAVIKYREFKGVNT